MLLRTRAGRHQGLKRSRMPAMRPLIPLTLLAALSFACKDKAKEPPPASEVPAIPAAKAAPVAKTPPPPPAGPGKRPTVSLLDPGAEPQRALRYRPKKGEKQTLKTIIEMEVATKLKGAPGPNNKMPPMHMTMTTQITAAGDNEFTYDFEITEASVGEAAGVPKTIQASVEKELGNLVGLKGTATVDSRGFTSEANLQGTAKMPPRIRELLRSMQQSLEQMSAPLPEEAVGRGAKWRVDQSIRQNGMLIEQQSVFEVVEIGKKTVELSISIDQHADAQTMSAPGLPAGTQLNRLVGKGNGTTVLNLGKLAPESSVVNVKTSTSMSVMVGRDAQSLETETTMTMKIAGS